MKSTLKPVARKDELVTQEYDGELLIYDLRSNKAFCLNETASLIWNACDGNRDAAQITKFIGDQLNAKANEDLVWLALDQLKKEKLVENAPDSDGRFAGMSRRDVVRKLAVGSSIAVPVIMGLTAPPAYAQASLGCGRPCTMDSDCMGLGMDCNNCLTVGMDPMNMVCA